MGEEWKALSHDKKIKYIEEAELLKKQYLARLADYKKEKAERDLENAINAKEPSETGSENTPEGKETNKNTRETTVLPPAFAVLKRIEKLVQTWAWTLKDARRALTCLRDEIRALADIDEELSMKHVALCDLLTMYLHTETFFTLHSYRKNTSRRMCIPMADVPGTVSVTLPNLKPAEEPYFETTVEYDEHYIHKEMLYWYDQGNANQMPVGLYGCVRLPSIESCFANNGVDCHSSEVTKYKQKTREKIIKYFEAKSFERPWPQECRHIFPDVLSQNMYQHVYGSPLFDELLKGVGEDEKSLPRTIRDLKRLSLRKKYKPLYKTENILSSLQPVEEVKEENWIQCENPECLKWRKVPVTVDVLKVPSPWTCKDNIWNPKRADCSVPEESYSQDTQYAYEVEDIAGTIGEYVDGFCQLDNTWHVCKIVDIREQDLEKEYLLHYSGWQSKYDEWVKGGCSHIKPLNTHTTIKQASRWIRSKKKKT